MKRNVRRWLIVSLVLLIAFAAAGTGSAAGCLDLGGDTMICAL